MTKEQVKKRKEVIRWWLENTDKGVLVDKGDGRGWQQCTNPSFSTEYRIIQNDGYAELRKAQADGKIVQYKGLSSQMYREMTDSDFNLHISNYRIKPEEPKFKVGDWIVNTSHAKPYEPMIVTQKMLDDKSPHNNGVHLELWTPTEGEWCVYEEMRGDEYVVCRYKKPEFAHSTKFYPLEYVMTLKDK